MSKNMNNNSKKTMSEILKAAAAKANQIKKASKVKLSFTVSLACRVAKDEIIDVVLKGAKAGFAVVKDTWERQDMIIRAEARVGKTIMPYRFTVALWSNGSDSVMDGFYRILAAEFPPANGEDYTEDDDLVQIIAALGQDNSPIDFICGMNEIFENREVKATIIGVPKSYEKDTENGKVRKEFVEPKLYTFGFRPEAKTETASSEDSEEGGKI